MVEWNCSDKRLNNHMQDTIPDQFRGRGFSMGAAENDRKHDNLSEWDPWV